MSERSGRRVAPGARRSEAVGTWLAAALVPAALAGFAFVVAGARSPARAVVAAALLSLALAGIGVVWFRTRIARPLRRLSESARSVSEPAGSVSEPAGSVSEPAPAPVAPERGAVHSLAATLDRVAAELTAARDRASEEQRSRDLILASMAEGVVLVAPGGAIRYANAAAGQMLGSLRGARVPSSLRDVVEEAAASGAPSEREIEAGAGVTVRAAAMPAGERGLVLIVLRDVTESRRTDAIRRDFAAAASHELKTPVASIQAVAETLVVAIEDDSRAAARFAAQLLDESRRLSRIVVDLLDLSRLEGARATMAPVRLDEIVATEVERHAARAAAGTIAIELDLAEATLVGSAADLGLMASNLIDNAIRFTKPEGTVRISVSAGAHAIVLAVADTGIGIPRRDLPRIFERFYRVDRARSRESGGTGLGLAIVKHVAEQHGARVEARSELGSGSTFTVTFPAS